MYFDNLSEEKADASVEEDNDALTWFQYTKAGAWMDPWVCNRRQM